MCRPTRAGMRQAIALDPADDDEPEAALGADTRIAQQLRALIGQPGARRVDPETGDPVEPAEYLDLSQLAAVQERELIQAIFAMHQGQDPIRSVAIHRELKKNAIEKALSLAGAT